jgi:hypothetical protein
MAFPFPDPAPLRAACLRAISQESDGPQAIVALSAEQFLRVHLASDDLPRWQARIGHRVWVDLSHEPWRLSAVLPPQGRHA